VADSMAAHGLPVVGLNAHHYFSTQRTPDGAARDLERVLRHYMALWGRDRVVLIGYSRGAETLPFMVSRLPADLVAHVAVIALIGPAPNANFKFHFVDLFEDKHRKDDLMTVPEIEKLRGRQVLCFYGKDEKASACRELAAGVATVVELSGGHHFGGNYAEIAARILEAASQTASR
jgi:type IV secretory pathway VirJ component